MKNFRIISSICSVILLLFLPQIKVNAAYLENVPITVVQPDGSTLQCFATGDEYYSWLHDQNNFTIIQDSKTGYYVYAVYIDGELSPTTFIAGKSDPVKAGLLPGANITAEKMLRKREEFWKNTPEKPVIPRWKKPR